MNKVETDEKSNNQNDIKWFTQIRLDIWTLCKYFKCPS